MNTQIVYHYKDGEEGISYYTLNIDGVDILRSSRTFLTMHECQIESEWLLHKLGLIIKSTSTEYSD